MTSKELRKEIIEEKYLRPSCTKWEWINEDYVMIYGNYVLIKEYLEDYPPFRIVFNEPGCGFIFDTSIAHGNYLKIRALIDNIFSK